MKLTDVVLKDVPMLSKNRPLVDAIDVLNSRGLESICVVDGEKPIGTLSFSDILFRIGTQRLRTVAPESLYISGFVREFPAQLATDTPVRRAAKLLLELDVPALPMFYGDTFLGLVYQREMLQFVEDSAVSISPLVRRGFPQLRPHDRIIHARKVILDSGIPLIPVINEDGRLLGVTGEREVLNALIDFQKYNPEKHQKARIRQLSISASMRREVPLVDESVPLGEASRRIMKERLPGLITTDSCRISGVISPSEILNYIVGSFPGEQ